MVDEVIPKGVVIWAIEEEVRDIFSLKTIVMTEGFYVKASVSKNGIGGKTIW